MSMANYPEDSDESVEAPSSDDDDLPFTDAELWPEIPEEPLIPPVLFEEAKAAEGWETEATKDTLDRRLDALKVPIVYDDDTEDEHILPLIDPGFPFSPPELPILDEEKSAWSMSMIGVALVFLVAANYMPS